MLLSLAIFLPIACGALLLALGRDEQANAVRWMALAAAVASFLVTLPLITGFDTSTAAMQFVENQPWIERFPINYHLGVGGTRGPRQPVHGRLPDPVGSDGGRVQRAGRHAVLCVLRGHADPDVHH